MNVSVSGADLFYVTRGVTRGRGPACLVLSSIGTAPYERQMPPALDGLLRLVFVDVRGSGRSTGQPTDLTFDVLADDLEAIREDVGVDRIAVLGHSMLGALALEYARRRPDSVSHVILAGAPPHGDMVALQAQGRAYFEAHASPERQQRLRENLGKLSAGTVPARAVMAQTPMRFYDADYDAGPLFEGAIPKAEVIMHILGTMLPGWDARAAARPLRAPTLVAHGRHDYVVPWTLWQDVAATLPATLRVFERSGHQPFVEEPEAFVAALSTLLRDGQ